MVIMINIGLMVESIRVIGRTVNNMEKENFFNLTMDGGKVYGMMEKELDGLLLRLCEFFIYFNFYFI
jgi:hypothetical protein